MGKQTPPEPRVAGRMGWNISRTFWRKLPTSRPLERLADAGLERLMKYLRIVTTEGVIQTDSSDELIIPMKVFEQASFNVISNGNPVCINPKQIVYISVVEE